MTVKEFLMNTLWYTLCVCKERCVTKLRQYFLFFLYIYCRVPFSQLPIELKKQGNLVGNINILLMSKCYVNKYMFLQTWIILHHGDIYHKKYWHRVSLTRRCSNLWLPTQTRWRLCYRRSTVNTCTAITASFAWRNFTFGDQNSFRIFMSLKGEIILKKIKINRTYIFEQKDRLKWFGLDVWNFRLCDKCSFLKKTVESFIKFQ